MNQSQNGYSYQRGWAVPALGVLGGVVFVFGGGWLILSSLFSEVGTKAAATIVMIAGSCGVSGILLALVVVAILVVGSAALTLYAPTTDTSPPAGPRPDAPAVDTSSPHGSLPFLAPPNGGVRGAPSATRPRSPGPPSPPPSSARPTPGPATTPPRRGKPPPSSAPTAA